MSSHQKARVAFTSAILLILLCGLAASVTVSRLRAAEQWVTHGHDVEIAIAELNTVLNRAGRLRTEYVNSGSPDRLLEYEAVAEQIPQKLEALSRLTADNPVQHANCAIFSELDNRRIGLMRQAVNLKASGKSDLENQAQLTQQIVAVATETDALTQRMDAEEQRLLEQRAANARLWFSAIVAILMCSLGGALILFWVHYRLLNREVDALEQAQNSLRALSARLMNLQDEERRKFSRELHDSLGQELAALKMILPMIERSKLEDANFVECMQSIDKAIAETRTISHLLHPPLLDEAGLVVAAKWYVDGFAQRSKLDVKVDMPDDLGRLPSATELTLFRILQESLTNIHRHSGATRAEIRVKRSSGRLVMEIRDFGKGVPVATLERFRSDATGAGVGLAGMRERIRELGGRFDIFADGSGTLIVVTVPLQEGSNQEDKMGEAVPSI
jgi:signal transduction histidine kinase